MNIQIKRLLVFSTILFIPLIKADLDLLETPAIDSKLAAKSILNDVTKYNDSFLAVGVRSHIINWQSPEQWQQEQAPVSVALTAISILPDGTKVAVGHDSAIIICAAGSNQWQKVFDGFELLKLKVALFNKQISSLKEQITATEDEDAKEELEYQLEELTYSLDDTIAEQKTGPDKPLLGIAATSTGKLFAVGAYGTLIMSSDKGATWTLQDDIIENPDRFHLNAVISSSDDKVYIVGESGVGFVSDDQGNSWSSMMMPYSGSIFGISAQDNSPNLIAFGLQGNMMLSNDSGKSWLHKKINSSASFLGGTITQNGRAYMVGHGGIILDVDVENSEDINIQKHPSGAVFSKVLIHNNNMILTGQYGITSQPIQNEG